MSFLSRFLPSKHADPARDRPSGPETDTIEDDTAGSGTGPADAVAGGTAKALDPASRANDTDHQISVFDPGSQKTFVINGEIVTGVGGRLEIGENLRMLLIASSEGEIYCSRSHQNSPQVLSEIKKIESILGPAKIKHAIDMMSLSEMYHRASMRRGQRATGPRNDQSKMQRELIGIVANAAQENASDVHIIVNADRAVIRYRIDGIMTYIREMQPQYAFDLLSSAFAMADTSDPAYQQRQYQSARISSITTELPTGVQSLRIQFNPLANEGRYLIMRILYSGSGRAVELDDLGYSEEQIRQINTMSARPVGINVISGPTGSGKSTTLKAVLEGVIRKRGGEVNSITIEDPPEYVIAAAQQMPVVNAKTQEERAEAFTQAISAGLRSDPDIMMIGEIRDRASADLAVEGALSGHPIYASLHANTAVDILSRLRDMGIEDFKVFDPTVFSGLIGQRLLRQICPRCRRPFAEALAGGEIDPLLAERIEDMRRATPETVLSTHGLHVAGPGCRHCTGGYKGRAVVAEIVLPDDRFMELMRADQKPEARTYWFEKMNGIDLLGSSWLRALEGRVSPIDVENSVALLAPLEAHRHALDYWTRKLGMC